MALSLLHANDQSGQYPDSWYAASAHQFEDGAKLKGKHTTDVAIIGGGYSGLSTALHLAERGFDVVVLEAHRVGWGASGRNGGQVASGQRLDPFELEELVGKETASAAHKIGIDAADLVRNLIAQHNIDCSYRAGIMDVNHKKSYDQHSAQYATRISDEYGCKTICYLPPDQVSEKLGGEGYSGGLLDTASGHLHPLNYALGLARAARSAGARIYEQSEVHSVAHGTPTTLKTTHGEIVCKNVIYACNGYLGSLEPKTSRQVMPINNFIIATEPLDKSFADTLIRDREAVADSRFVVNYFRLSEDNRMLFGGGENYGYRFPTDIKSFVRPKMLKIFPQLSDARIDYGWGGTLAITRHRIPSIRRISNNGLSISGYSGSGVAMATMAGKLAAELLDGKSEGFETMAKLPTPDFPGGTLLRWPLLVAAMLWYSLRDRV